MKKKLMLLLAAVMTVSVLAGCGAEDKGESQTNTENSETVDLMASVDLESFSDVAKDKPVEEYVTLGEYKGVEVTVEKVTATKEEIDELSLQVYLDFVTAENGGITDRPIENGDTANIDYVGKKDGVAFDGGTANGYNLGIGSGSFIPGFEDGLVGVKPGETVDLKLTFPANYQSADLAGKEVVFTVTVNYIAPTQVEDKVVAGFEKEEFSNVQELNTYAEEYLNSRKAEEFAAEAEYAVLTAVMDNAEFGEIPEEMIEKQREVVNSTLNLYASYYGIDAATYTAYFYQMDLESFVSLQAEDYAKQQLVYQAIANAEGMNISDRELEENLIKYASGAGASSVEEYLGETDREDFRDSLMMEKMYNFIQENAVVKEK